MEKKLSEMKASELHRILAKVLEIAETSGFCAPSSRNAQTLMNWRESRPTSARTSVLS